MNDVYESEKNKNKKISFTLTSKSIYKSKKAKSLGMYVRPLKNLW